MQDQNRNDDNVQQSDYISSLRNVLLGKTSTALTLKRVYIGGVVGIIVGFVESGIVPKSKQQLILLLLFIGLRFLTGITYALLRWKMSFLIKGILVSLFYTLPLLILTNQIHYPRILLLGVLSGFIISYGIERISHKSK